MLSAVLLIFTSTLLLWLVIKWRKVSKYWAVKGVPHDPPHPIWGSLTFLQKENIALWMRRMYDKFQSPYIGIWVFHRPGLIVNSPELARRILVKDADNFRNRFLGSGASDPIGALNIFTANDPQWTNIRRRLTFVFTAAKLRCLQGLIKTKVDDLVNRIHKEMKKDPKDFHLREMFTDYTTDIIGEAAFGLKSEATRTGDSAIRKVTREFMKFSVFRGLCWSSIFFFPDLVDVFGFTFFPKESTSFLKQIFRTVVAQRGGYERPPTESKDLLDALIKMKAEAKLENEDIPEEVLLAQAAIFLQAGFDTSGGALSWLTYELAHYPYQQEKLYKEMLEAKQKYGTDDFSTTQLVDLPYLNAVIKEVGRKYPPMGWLDRIAAHEYKIDDKLTIPAGTILYVNAVGMHMDPQYFPNPDTFDPERFMPQNEKNIVPYSYLPFGEGPRICIGMRFAQIQMRLAVAKLSLKFEIHPVQGAPAPNQIQTEKRGLLYMPDDHMPIRFVPRNQAQI